MGDITRRNPGESGPFDLYQNHELEKTLTGIRYVPVTSETERLQKLQILFSQASEASIRTLSDRDLMVFNRRIDSISKDTRFAGLGWSILQAHKASAVVIQERKQKALDAYTKDSVFSKLLDWRAALEISEEVAQHFKSFAIMTRAKFVEGSTMHEALSQVLNNLELREHFEKIVLKFPDVPRAEIVKTLFVLVYGNPLVVKQHLSRIVKFLPFVRNYAVFVNLFRSLEFQENVDRIGSYLLELFSIDRISKEQCFAIMDRLIIILQYNGPNTEKLLHLFGPLVAQKKWSLIITLNMLKNASALITKGHAKELSFLAEMARKGNMSDLLGSILCAPLAPLIENLPTLITLLQLFGCNYREIVRMFYQIPIKEIQEKVAVIKLLNKNKILMRFDLISLPGFKTLSALNDAQLQKLLLMFPHPDEYLKILTFLCDLPSEKFAFTIEMMDKLMREYLALPVNTVSLFEICKNADANLLTRLSLFADSLEGLIRLKDIKLISAIKEEEFNAIAQEADLVLFLKQISNLLGRVQFAKTMLSAPIPLKKTMLNKMQVLVDGKAFNAFLPIEAYIKILDLDPAQIQKHIRLWKAMSDISGVLLFHDEKEMSKVKEKDFAEGGLLEKVKALPASILDKMFCFFQLVGLPKETQENILSLLQGVAQEEIIANILFCLRHIPSDEWQELLQVLSTTYQTTSNYLAMLSIASRIPKSERGHFYKAVSKSLHPKDLNILLHTIKILPGRPFPKLYARIATLINRKKFSVYSGAIFLKMLASLHDEQFSKLLIVAETLCRGKLIPGEFFNPEMFADLPSALLQNAQIMGLITSLSPQASAQASFLRIVARLPVEEQIPFADQFRNLVTQIQPLEAAALLTIADALANESLANRATLFTALRSVPSLIHIHAILLWIPLPLFLSYVGIFNQLPYQQGIATILANEASAREYLLEKLQKRLEAPSKRDIVFFQENYQYLTTLFGNAHPVIERIFVYRFIPVEGLKSPPKIYQNHKKTRAISLPSALVYQKVADTQVSLNIASLQSSFFERLQQEVSLAELDAWQASPPTVNIESFEAEYADIRLRLTRELEKVSEDDLRALESILHSTAPTTERVQSFQAQLPDAIAGSYAHRLSADISENDLRLVLEDIRKNQKTLQAQIGFLTSRAPAFIRKTLTRGGNPDTCPSIERIQIATYLKNLPHPPVIEKGDFLTDRQRKILVLLEACKVCDGGQIDNLSALYATTIMAPGALTLKTVAVKAIKANLENLVWLSYESWVGMETSGSGKFLPKVAGQVFGLDGKGYIAQESHQSLYVKNALSRSLGYTSWPQIKYDSHSHLLSYKLLTYTPESLLYAFQTEVSLEALIALCQEKLTLAAKESFDEIYQGTIQIFKPAQVTDPKWTPEDITDIWEFNEEDEAIITKYGTLRVLIEMGILVTHPKSVLTPPASSSGGGGGSGSGGGDPSTGGGGGK